MCAICRLLRGLACASISLHQVGEIKYYIAHPKTIAGNSPNLSSFFTIISVLCLQKNEGRLDKLC